ARREEDAPPRRRSTAKTSPARGKPSLLPGPGVAERRAVILITFLLVVYGLVMAYSASSAEAYFQYDSSFYFVKRQLLWVLIGVVAMWVLSRVDYAWWRRAAVPLAVLVLVGLTAVLVPGIGTSINGARRWIVVGGGQGLQPSELAKLAAVVLVAALIVRRPREIESPAGFMRLVGIGIVPASVLIMLEPDLGTTLVLVVAVVAVLIAAGTRLRYLFALVAAGCLTVLALIAVEPYRLERLVTFFDPWKDPQGSGFQATQSLISIASGRIFGVGLGNSVQKFGFLPEQGTDMITGIIGEELGLIGLVVLLALYVTLAWACFRIALNCKEMFGKLLAAGITAIIVGQACINVGAALGLLPLTGVPLPLVSLGGTSLVVVLAGLGILLNIATNRRSYIVVSAQRKDRAARGGGDRRSSAAGARRRG
ncbi:MAG: putative lipid II flippase FtsW, partial [Actinobacteria bacterium]|nr:putative lipid II flippase FtsW [Actinomycetota bacterium]